MNHAGHNLLMQLPPPPSGRSGWPWTEAPPPLPAAMPDGSPWPRISIVTPSFNQGRYIEATIRSVLLQGYPNLEYFVVDGGSADVSVAVIRRYAPWIDHWVSERDRGQSHAINKGLARSTGEIFNWINSDDLLMPGALAEVGRLWAALQPDIVTGGSHVVHAEGAKVVLWPPTPPREPLDLIRPNGTTMLMAQPSTFLSGPYIRATGGVREDLHFIMDWELHFRVVCARRGGLRVAVSPAVLSAALLHPTSKTSTIADRRFPELELVLGDLRGAVLTPLEWLRLAPLLRRLQIWRLVAGARASRRPLHALLRLLLRRPDFLASRFFIGALRRSLHM